MVIFRVFNNSYSDMAKVFICLSMVLVGSLAIPVKDELMFEGPDDTATVESTVREARAAPKHIGDLIKPAKGAAGEESRKEYSVFEDGENKKQPKKKVEAEFNYFGEDGDGGDSGGSYYGEGSSSEGEGEGGENAESSEGGEGRGDGEEKEEYSEESEEGEGEGGEEENDY